MDAHGHGPCSDDASGAGAAKGPGESRWEPGGAGPGTLLAPALDHCPLGYF